MTTSTMDILQAARLIANYAIEEGAQSEQHSPRATYYHMGAVLADSILQAGLNYKSVVRPRVQKILRSFPDRDKTSDLLNIVNQNGVSKLLNWQHHQKIERFEQLVLFLHQHNIETVQELRAHLRKAEFCDDLQSVNGIGPKTVDYMACLVGIDSIAVDRHIRNFAQKVGIDANDYVFLRNVFSYAADLLAISRRDFDAWIWRKESSSQQLSLAI
ncbi:hypothetical protein [Terasakiella pusilla]|uniref:hypothetical protein n=1 Tax=Terasakiella pusilla TaxID=64973 RepID=UPI003AA8B96F